VRPTKGIQNGDPSRQALSAAKTDKMLPGRHPNSLAALARYRLVMPGPKCSKCGRLAVKGRTVCYWHGGANGRPPKSPHRVAVRAVKLAMRSGLVASQLASDSSWQRAQARWGANIGASLAMLGAYGARDAEAWARAIRGIV